MQSPESILCPTLCLQGGNCVTALTGDVAQSCFLDGGFAKAPAIMDTNIAMTRTADMRTKHPKSRTRMNSKGCLKCLWAASLVKLLIASTLSLIKCRPSLQPSFQYNSSLRKVHARTTSQRVNKYFMQRTERAERHCDLPSTHSFGAQDA